MGNRAVLTFAPYDEANVGVYLHWAGGLNNVRGLLDACVALGFRTPGEDPSYAMARLIDAATAMIPGSLSVGVGICSKLDTDNGDNGTYVIGAKWEIAERLFIESRQKPNLRKAKITRDMVVAALHEVPA